jgi:hypothetical protein
MMDISGSIFRKSALHASNVIERNLALVSKLTGKNIYDAIESDFARPIAMQDFDRSRQKKISNILIDRMSRRSVS